MKRICFLVVLLLVFSNVFYVHATSDTTTITDIKNWNHPVKTVLNNYGIGITKVELLKNKTYPIIYCTFPTYSELQEKAVFEKMLKDVLSKNGYWSYKLVGNSFEVSVTGNLKDKKYIGIAYKNIDKYFRNFSNVGNIKITYQQAIKIMRKNFGEDYNTGITEEGNYEVWIINAIDGIIEYNDKYYYTVHTFETHSDHAATYGWALIDASDGSVYYNNLDGTISPKGDTKRLINLGKYNDGNNYKLLSSSIGYDNLAYLWQYNKKTKEIQKIDLDNLKILRNIKLSETLIKGDIVCFAELGNSVYTNKFSNTVLVGVKDNGKYYIYKSINENDKFRWRLDVDLSNNELKELNDMCYNGGENEFTLSLNGGSININFKDDSGKGWADLMSGN